MRSLKQIENSRINGTKSRGPISIEGKATSSQNAKRDALLADTIVLTTESRLRFLKMTEAYVSEYQPTNEYEAASQWRLLRTQGLRKASMEIAVANREGPAPVRTLQAREACAATNEALLKEESTYVRQSIQIIRLLHQLRLHRIAPFGGQHSPPVTGATWEIEYVSAPQPEPEQVNL